jgi:hypothetical protein
MALRITAGTAMVLIMGRSVHAREPGRQGMKDFRLDFWRQHPDWLQEAYEMGIEESNDPEDAIRATAEALP